MISYGIKNTFPTARPSDRPSDRPLLTKADVRLRKADVRLREDEVYFTEKEGMNKAPRSGALTRKDTVDYT